MIIMAYDILAVLRKNVTDNVIQAKAEGWTAAQIEQAIKVKEIQLIEKLVSKR